MQLNKRLESKDFLKLKPLNKVGNKESKKIKIKKKHCEQLKSTTTIESIAESQEVG